jgi:hypothetical protein
MGFKHTISDSQMKSEFFLAKAGMQNTPPSKAVQKEAVEDFGIQSQKQLFGGQA